MITMENNKCVYLHKDKEGIVRYVGSGSIQRARQLHASSGRGKRYKDFVELNGKLSVMVVVEGITKVDAENLERDLYVEHINTVLNYRKPSSNKVMKKEMFEDILYYDESSKSCLRWKLDRKTLKADSEAGYISEDGYYVVWIGGHLYKTHRIISVLHDIDVYNKVIDHIDRDRLNNNILNLRTVSQMQNTQNRNLDSRNTSGVQGVYYDKVNKRWIVGWNEKGKFKRKSFPISKYTSSEDAFQAAVTYRKEMQNIHYS